MNNIKKEKKYDSVKMMREIRDRLSKEYSQNPEKELYDLKKIRSKYKIHSNIKAS